MYRGSMGRSRSNRTTFVFCFHERGKRAKKDRVRCGAREGRRDTGDLRCPTRIVDWPDKGFKDGIEEEEFNALGCVGVSVA